MKFSILKQNLYSIGIAICIVIFILSVPIRRYIDRYSDSSPTQNRGALVIDEENLLDSQSVRQLEEQCREIREETDVEVSIIASGHAFSKTKRFADGRIQIIHMPEPPHPGALTNEQRLNHLGMAWRRLIPFWEYPKQLSWVVLWVHLESSDKVSFSKLTWGSNLWYADFQKFERPYFPAYAPKIGLKNYLAAIRENIVAHQMRLAPQGRGKNGTLITVWLTTLCILCFWATAFIYRVLDGRPKHWFTLPLEWITGIVILYIVMSGVVRVCGLFVAEGLSSFIYLTGYGVFWSVVVVLLCSRLRILQLLTATVFIVLSFVAAQRFENPASSYDGPTGSLALTLWGLNPFHANILGIVLNILLIGLCLRMGADYLGETTSGFVGNFKGKANSWEANVCLITGKPPASTKSSSFYTRFRHYMAITTVANIYWIIILLCAGLHSYCLSKLRSPGIRKSIVLTTVVSGVNALVRLPLNAYQRSFYADLHNLHLAYASFDDGNFREAEALASKALRGFRSLNRINPFVMQSERVWEAFSFLGSLYFYLGEMQHGVRALEEGLQLSRGGSFQFQLKTLRRLMYLYFDLGDFERATESGKRAIHIVEELKRTFVHDGKPLTRIDIMRYLNSGEFGPLIVVEAQNLPQSHTLDTTFGEQNIGGESVSTAPSGTTPFTNSATIQETILPVAYSSSVENSNFFAAQEVRHLIESVMYEMELHYQQTLLFEAIAERTLDPGQRRQLLKEATAHRKTALELIDSETFPDLAQSIPLLPDQKPKIDHEMDVDSGFSTLPESSAGQPLSQTAEEPGPFGVEGEGEAPQAFNHRSLWKGISTDSLDSWAWIGWQEALRCLPAEPERARSLVQVALSRYEASKNGYLGVANCYYLLSEIAIIQEEWPEAELLARNAIKLSETLGHAILQQYSYFQLGKVYAHQGMWREALPHYQSCLQITESVRGGVESFDTRTSYSEDKSPFYEAVVFCCIQINEYDLALSYVESAKSRTFIDLLGNQRVDIRAGVPPQLLQDAEALRVQINRLNADMRETHPEIHTDEGQTDDEATRQYAATGAARIDRQLWQSVTRNHAQQKQFQELKALQEQEINIWARIRRLNPEFASLKTVDPIRRTEMQSMLDGETAVVEYFSCQGKWYVFLLLQSHIYVRELNTSQTRIVDLLHVLQSTVQSTLSDTKRKWAVFFELYRDLFEPLESILEEHTIGTLIFVPHGPLHLLPFHALSSAPSGRERFLLDQYRIVYAPSASVLKYCRQKTSLTSRSLFAIGNPTHDLKYAECEVNLLASCFEKASTVSLREQATTAFAKQEAGHHSFVHFSCHGVFDAYQPLQSHLALADGAFTVLDIMNDLHLQAELVTLSACQTGRVHIGGGDEITGLTRALLYAGSPALLATLWSVDDLATALLIRHFYEQISTDGNKAVALQKAQQFVREITAFEVCRQLESLSDSETESPELTDRDRGELGQHLALLKQHKPDTRIYRHPYYWAAFVFIGDHHPRKGSSMS